MTRYEKFMVKEAEKNETGFQFIEVEKIMKTKEIYVAIGYYKKDGVRNGDNKVYAFDFYEKNGERIMNNKPFMKIDLSNKIELVYEALGRLLQEEK